MSNLLVMTVRIVQIAYVSLDSSDFFLFRGIALENLQFTRRCVQRETPGRRDGPWHISITVTS